MVEIDEMGF